MDAIRWKSRPELRDPVLVCAFNGWNDAGEAASAALGTDPRRLRRERGRRDRFGGVLRLHSRAADHPAHRGPDASHRLAREQIPRRARPGGGARPAPVERHRAVAALARIQRLDHQGRGGGRRRPRRHPGCAARGRPPHAAGRGHRLRVGRDADRPPRLPAFELRGPDRRGRRASPRMPAARHAFGEPVGVGPALRRRRARTQRPRSRSFAASRASSAWRSTPRRSRRPRRSTSARSTTPSRATRT